MKSRNGITLIALVITIIVLLILAGVSISTIAGENGIIEQAKESATKTKDAEIKEQENIDDLEEYINNSTKAKTLVQAFKDGDIQVGDYVDYAPSNLNARLELTEYDIYEVDETMQWRVLGLNEEENQLLLTSDNTILQSDNLYGVFLSLSGSDYYDFVETLNNISMIYHNEKLASETRSITIEDINNALGIVVEENIVYQKDDETKTNIDIVNTLGKSYTYKVGDYGLENYLKEVYPDNQEIQELVSRKVGDVIESTAYGYKYEESSIIDNNTPLYEMLFEGTNDRNQKDGVCAKSYWVASPGIIANEYGVEHSIGGVVIGRVCKGYEIGFSSNGYTISMVMGVKPVVALKPNITIEQINIIPGEYQVWDIDNSDATWGHQMNIYRGQIAE